jgi:hypothetical protein
MKKAAEIRRPIAKKRRLFRSDVQGSSRNKENSNRSTLSVKRPRRPVSRVLFGKGAPRPPSTSPVTNARFGSIGEGDGAKQVNDLHRGQCQKESSGDGGEGSLAEWIEGGKGNSTNEDNLDEDEEAVTEDLESSEGGATQQGSVATDGKFAAEDLECDTSGDESDEDSDPADELNSADVVMDKNADLDVDSISDTDVNDNSKNVFNKDGSSSHLSSKAISDFDAEDGTDDIYHDENGLDIVDRTDGMRSITCTPSNESDRQRKPHDLMDLSELLEENQRALCARGLARSQPFRRSESRREDRSPHSGTSRAEIDRSARLVRRRAGRHAGSGSTLSLYEGGKSDGDDDDITLPAIPETIETRWSAYIHFLAEDFCDPRNDDAALRGQKERIRPGEISYRGLLVSHETNEDVKFIYTHMYEAKALRGQSIASYEQLRACVGQFARFSVTSGRVSLEKAWAAGQIFCAVLDMDVVKTFLSYFRLRCSASTCLSKSFHLRTVSKYAERYFCSISIDNSCKARAALMTDFLTGSCAAEKFESRRGTARMRCEERRISSGKLLLGRDFRSFGKAAEQRLDSIIQNGPEAVRSSSGLLSRWCIAFAGLLCFHGSGQRPQVYAQLQEPEDLDIALRRWARDKRVTLAALLEKRPRQSGFSKVSFPGHLLKFFEFHCRVVKPSIRQALGQFRNHQEKDLESRGTDEDRDNPLLLNTRNGEAYSPYQVRSTLHRFVQSVDPELTSVTPSSLRSSYATWQFRAFKEGKIFEGLPEDDFLDKLAKVMNTSPEQLKATYIACSAMDSDYDLIMAEFHEMFQRENENPSNVQPQN